MRKMTKRSTIIAGVAVAAVGIGASAWAAGWFQGSSETKVTTSSIGNVTATVDLQGDAAKKLYPGKTIEVKGVTVTNPNDYPVKLTSVSAISVSGDSDCGQTEAGFSFPELTGVTFPAGQTTGVDLGDIKMSPSASENCAGSNLVITATLTGAIA